VSRKQSSLSAIAVLFSLTAVVPSVVAQSTSSNGSFPLPKGVPNGTVVRVNGSSSMAKINEALGQKFKTQYSGTDVKVTYDGTDAALKAVLDGKSDLAGIGRQLTDGEKAKGLVATSVSRNKIAMFVGKDNPWKGGLTINQFAQMFRGEVTDWSKVGGKAGKIRVIDRPDGSDTRKAFQNYPVFKQAPFKAGTNAVRLKEDSTDAVIKALGKNGIGYAIADQVVKNPNLRIVAMHKVAPTDPRYPFSQPLMYVYKGTKPSPAAQAFLGYATASENQQVVEQARTEAAKSNTTVVAPLNAPNQAEANNSTNSANSGNAGTSTSEQQNSPGNIATVADAIPSSMVAKGIANPTDSENKFPWWLLFIPLLGGLLWWVMKGLGSPTAVAPIAAAAVAATAAKPRNSRIVLTPRNNNEGYAYWEIPEHVKEDLRREGKRGMKLRLYDVTDVDNTNIDEINLSNQTLVGEYNCQEREPDLHVGIPASNRDYVAEIGYENSDETWLQVARSEKVRVPAFVEQTSEIPATSFSTSLANEEINEEQLQASSLWGDTDVATIRPTSSTNNASSANPSANPSVNLSKNSDTSSGNNLLRGLGGAAVVGGAIGGASLLNFFGKHRKSEVGNQSVDESKVVLVPRSADSAYAYWEISAAQKQELQNQGGQKLELRLYDTTDIDLETQPVEAIQQYECGADNDLHISIPACERDYLAELGYIKNDDNWLPIAHSEPVRVSSSMTELGGSNPQSKLSIEAVKVATNNLANNISNKTSDIASDTMNAPVNLVDRTTRGFSGWMGEAAKTVGTKLAGGAAAVAGVGTVTHAFFDKKGLSRNGGTVETLEVSETTEITETLETVKTNGYPRTTKKQCQIILVPRNFQDAYAYWEVSEDYKQAARDQGGSKFALRVHDATNLDIDTQQPHATQEFFCDENAFDQHIPIPLGDKQSLTPRAYRDYIAEVGYYTPDNRWVRIIRSFHVRVKP
jgi:phosphate transport system substrate-binding protein